jgi:hypothetical protein
VAFPNFIEHLGVPPSDVAKLRSLGTDTPEQLLAQIYAAPDAFERFMGHDATLAVERSLRAMVPDPVSVAPMRPSGVLGVPLGPAPTHLAALEDDLRQRDALFADVERLKAAKAPSARIAAAEHALDDWFSRHGQ